MRRISIVIFGVVALYGLCIGSDKPAVATGETAVKSHQHMPLNNVVKMDAEGKRTALCCCGYEFTVTPTAPTMDHEGTSFYMCGEGCKEMAMKATPEENAKTMAAWHEKYDALSMADNTHMKDGARMATCVCGAEFAVTENTPIVTENGVTMYLCGEGCAEHFSAMSADERLTPEKKVAAGM